MEPSQFNESDVFSSLNLLISPLDADYGIDESKGVLNHIQAW